MQNNIHTFHSDIPGPSVAVFCGVHGNEKAGIIAVRKYIEDFMPKRGTVHFVFANPKAIELGVRFIEKNLNRCFTLQQTAKAHYEEQLAEGLKLLLDDCDALLDLHGYNSEEDRPFAICESNSFDVVKELGTDTVITNLSEISTGSTDVYMHQNGKIGICLECGSNHSPEKYVPFAMEAISNFLAYFGITEKVTTSPPLPQLRLKAIVVAKKETNNFHFDKKYMNFDKLDPGTVFAKDGNKEYIAPANSCIIFPRPEQIIGHEAFILAEELEQSA